MEKDFTHYTEQLLERDDQDLLVQIEIDWFFDEGEQLEPGGPKYGRGWSCSSLVAREVETNRVVTLTEREEEIIREECHPDVLPDPRDAECDYTEDDFS